MKQFSDSVIMLAPLINLVRITGQSNNTTHKQLTFTPSESLFRTQDHKNN